MTIYARIAALCLFASLICRPVQAAPPTPEGEWLVKDRSAHIHIVSCSGKMWGVVSWTSEPAGVDSNNPDPLKRNRPVLGLPILLGMQPVDDEWDGDIYNADNGRTYHGIITMPAADVLHVKGCLIGHVLCGGEDWTRLAPDPKGKSAEAICKKSTD